MTFPNFFRTKKRIRRLPPSSKTAPSTSNCVTKSFFSCFPLSNTPNFSNNKQGEIKEPPFDKYLLFNDNYDSETLLETNEVDQIMGVNSSITKNQKLDDSVDHDWNDDFKAIRFQQKPRSETLELKDDVDGDDFLKNLFSSEHELDDCKHLDIQTKTAEDEVKFNELLTPSTADLTTCSSSKSIASACSKFDNGVLTKTSFEEKNFHQLQDQSRDQGKENMNIIDHEPNQGKDKGSDADSTLTPVSQGGWSTCSNSSENLNDHSVDDIYIIENPQKVIDTIEPYRKKLQSNDEIPISSTNSLQSHETDKATNKCRNDDENPTVVSLGAGGWSSFPKSPSSDKKKSQSKNIINGAVTSNVIKPKIQNPTDRGSINIDFHNNTTHINAAGPTFGQGETRDVYNLFDVNDDVLLTDKSISLLIFEGSTASTGSKEYCEHHQKDQCLISQNDGDDETADIVSSIIAVNNRNDSDDQNMNLDGRDKRKERRRALILLFDQPTLQFEFLSITYYMKCDDDERISFQTLLQIVSRSASHPPLQKQSYRHFCLMRNGIAINNHLTLQDYDVSCSDILLAIPDSDINEKEYSEIAKQTVNDRLPLERCFMLKEQFSSKKKEYPNFFEGSSIISSQDGSYHITESSVDETDLICESFFYSEHESNKSTNEISFESEEIVSCGKINYDDSQILDADQSSGRLLDDADELPDASNEDVNTAMMLDSSEEIIIEKRNDETTETGISHEQPKRPMPKIKIDLLDDELSIPDLDEGTNDPKPSGLDCEIHQENMPLIVESGIVMVSIIALFFSIIFISTSKIYENLKIEEKKKKNDKTHDQNQNCEELN